MAIHRKIRVLVIDDSALMRQMLSAILNEDPRIDVVGTAQNPNFAKQKIKNLQPDVLTLDVEMPEMDGITFLEQLMQQDPMPVVMVSAHTKKSANATLRALELGAIDFVTKPDKDIRDNLEGLAHEIRSKVKTAAQAHVHLPSTHKPIATSLAQGFPDAELQKLVVAIGASAGGTEAIKEILQSLSPPIPGIVIVQHMPEKFTSLFAQRLDGQCQIQVKEAQHGDIVVPNTAFIAPGNQHMVLRAHGGRHLISVFNDEPVNRHRPSVDVLFRSIAKSVGPRAMGIILTGMGKDGAQGLLAMHQAGAYTVAQDKKSCVVFGMPDQAIRLGAVSRVSPLDRMVPHILGWLQSGKAKRSAFK